MGILILKPGVFTSIQDQGRIGGQAFGISVNGVMDKKSAQIANMLVGNNINEAVLEMTIIGPTLHFKEDMIIAIVGASMNPTLNGKKIKQGRPIQVNKGDTLSIGKAIQGVRTYLSVKGGFIIPKIFNSKSTNNIANFGGFFGRPLKAGDQIPIATPFKIGRLSWGLYTRGHFPINSHIIHFIRGRQYDWFTSEAKQTWLHSQFTISKDSNRVGYRLLGPTLETNKKQELATEGTTFGSIQVPSNGHPIILMADRQPTGGYPKIGEVISVDLPKLSQLKPGDHVQFIEVSLKEAHKLLVQEHKEQVKLQIACQLMWKRKLY